MQIDKLYAVTHDKEKVYIYMAKEPHVVQNTIFITSVILSQQK